MAYRVATKPNGEKVWWKEEEELPQPHISIRPATAAETVIMDQILELDPNHNWAIRPEGLALDREIAELMAETD